MLSTQINQALSEQDMQDIKSAIDLIQTKLPFLITLSTDDRKRMIKMGDKRFAFVKNSLSAAQNNPNILPASFDLNEFTKDYQLALQLNELRTQLQQLQEQVDDTAMSLGSEAMSNSLTVYDYVKTASKKTPGLKGLADQLGTAFKAIKAKTPKAEPIADADLN
jgi:hypothetical protein